MFTTSAHSDQHVFPGRLPLKAHDLTMVGINTAHGGAADWGLAALPGRENEFVASVDQALEYATAFGRCAVHVMGGLAGAIPKVEAWGTYIRNLEVALRRAEGTGVQLLIEPLNPHDVPGYLLSRQAQAHAVVQDVGAPNLKVQMDLYHVARTEGDVAGALRLHLPGGRVGHLQVAGVPGRHEPEGGTVDWPQVFRQLDAPDPATGQPAWAGWVGCEYLPSRREPGGTSAGLGWCRRWLR